MDKFKQILNNCKCGIYLTINQHRDYYQSATERLDGLDCTECPPSLDPKVRQKMIETDTIVELQFYPDTPIGSYCIYHYDLDEALNEALEIINSENNNR